MGNILRVLKRDTKRLLKAPTALIVLVAILVLPSAYTWYNVVAFWDPYGNTGNMSVSVVNLDAGADNDLTGKINIGDSIVESLSENEQLKWSFLDEDEAMDKLKAGETYAVYVIPSNFSENLLSVTTGNFTQPKIQYYVNEKAGPVSPKITDSGSNALEETINSTFVETVSDAIVKALSEAMDNAESETALSKSKALQKIDEACASISNTRANLAAADLELAALQSKKDYALESTDKALASMADIQKQLTEIQNSTSNAEKQLIESDPAFSEAYNKGISALLALSKTTEEYKSEAENTPSGQLALGLLKSTTTTLQTAVTAEQEIVGQSKIAIGQIDTLAANTRTAMAKTNTMLGDIESDLMSVRNDIATLSASSAIESLLGVSSLDADAIADFMGSPTTIRTEQLYSLSSYGAAMAPLFMNLTFWIGAFMFLVVFRQEVDDEEIENLTITQRHLSRFIQFAIPAVIQAVVCCSGLLALGMVVVSAPAMYLASMVASLAYVSVIYALSVVFQHVGKGICIVLVFLQIPSATGLYPIEMTAQFYQDISPLFPFTYCIASLREAICGFYGMTYWSNIGMLLVFFVASLLLGIALRPITSNLNRMVAREISETGLMNGEQVEVPERKYRISQMAMALTNRAGYRDELQQRYNRYLELYPKLIKGTIIAGIAGPIVLGFIPVMFKVDKVVVLTSWLVWFLIIVIVATAIEVIRHGFRSQFELNDMTEEQIADNYLKRKGMHQSVHVIRATTKRRPWEKSEFDVKEDGTQIGNEIPKEGGHNA